MLVHGASDDLLVRAAAANQTAWMTRIAEAAGGVVHRERGVTWMTRVRAPFSPSPASRRRLDALPPSFLAAGTGSSRSFVLLGSLLYRQLGFRSVGVAQTWWR